ncbi:MAG: hypothetical protein EAX86_08230 [Candidatus Heimdallarchaeota archaeon]|nr:hypothetical protein [Candidatus Heimdallarchaeota archaeon]
MRFRGRMWVQSFKIDDPTMPSKNRVFPAFPPNTYGVINFWAEEYWAFEKIRFLKNKYPNLEFEGIIAPDFYLKLHNYLKKHPHNQVLNSRSYNDLPFNIWNETPKLLNVSPSHAPAKFIAGDYLKHFDENFGIITLDAHLDFRDNHNIHNAWITKNLASRTVVIGLWGDSSNELNNLSNFAFSEYQLSRLIQNQGFIKWLEEKYIYVTIDLDFYQISRNPFMGYANFWHRDLIIGHSMNLEQQLEEYKELNSDSNVQLGEILGYFTDLESFRLQKIKSVETQSKEIRETLKILSMICNRCSAKILRLDFVEYSPLTDWKQITFNEFINSFSTFYKAIESALLNPGSF